MKTILQTQKEGLEITLGSIPKNGGRKLLPQIPNLIYLQPATWRQIKVNPPEKVIYSQGVITTKAQTLALETADCLPLVFWQKESKLLGTLHFGYLQLLFGVLPHFLQQWQKVGGDFVNTFAFIGPGICGRCYTQGGWRVLKTWLLGGSKRLFVQKHEKQRTINLKSAAKYYCLVAGIKRQNIEEASVCTFEDNNLASYRRQKKSRLTNLLTVADWHE